MAPHDNRNKVTASRRGRPDFRGMSTGGWGRRGTLASVLITLLALLASLPTCHAGAQSSPFFGITIIELADEQVADALRGREVGGSSHIVTFVSDQGSYAALLAHEQQRLCIAWAVSRTDDSITFGLPPTKQSLGLVYPEVCMPFTLTFTGENRIRLVADNPYSKKGGPLVKQAQKVHYEGEHRVIAQIPLIDIDWEMPQFSRYAVNDIKVGPLRAGQYLDLNQKNPTRPFAYTWQTLVTLQDPQDSSKTHEAMGGIIANKVFGTPWDILYAVYTEKHPDKVFQTEVFDQAVLERYGAPTAAITGIPNYTKEFYWLFDLQGHQAALSGQDSCSATFDFWKHENSLAVFDKDIGPWGCSLVMIVSHNGNGVRPRVSNYRSQAISGHMLAWQHFKKTVEEAETARHKIEEVKSFRPQL